MGVSVGITEGFVVGVREGTLEGVVVGSAVGMQVGMRKLPGGRKMLKRFVGSGNKTSDKGCLKCGRQEVSHGVSK